MNDKWDQRFLKIAQEVSTWSKDPSTKCGAVVTRGKTIVSLGFNGFPAGCEDSKELYEDRTVKYARVIHAEINAILSAKQDLTGCTIYVYPLPPCSQCAAAIIQSGINTVIAPPPSDALEGRWGSSTHQATKMYQEAGVLLLCEDMLLNNKGTI